MNDLARRLREWDPYGPVGASAMMVEASRHIEEAHTMLREVRMYALGTDASTMNLIERVDAFLCGEKAQ